MAPHILSPLRQPRLALVWAGLAFSALGDQLCTVAFSWVAVAVFGAAAGYLSAGYSVIILLAASVGGGLADRWNRRWSMVAADALRCASLLWLVGAWLADGGPSVAPMLGVIVALALGEALFTPALQTVLPALVGDQRLLPATNALFDATGRLARLFGPGLIALAGGFIPVMHFFTLDAASFVLSGAAVAAIGTVAGEGAARAGARLWRGDLRRGFEAVRGHRLLDYMFKTSCILNGTWSAVFFLALPLAITQLHVGDGGGAELGAYGLVLSCYGVFNLAANIAMGSCAQPERPAATLFGGVALTGAGMVALGLAFALPLPADWRLPALAAAAALSSLGGPPKDIVIATMRQTHVPSALMASAMRAQLVVSYTGMLVAMLATPLLCDWLGAVTVIGLGGAIYLAVAAAGWLRPALRAHAFAGAAGE